MSDKTPTIYAPRLEVVYETEEGQELELDLQTDQRDQFAFSMVRRSTPNIPSVNDDPLLWMSFLAWSALKRSDVPEAKNARWDEFLGKSLVSVKPTNSAEMGGDHVGPLEQTTA